MPPIDTHNQNTLQRTAWNVKPSVFADAGDTTFRVDFDVTGFERALAQKGVNLCVYRSTYCPNVKSVDAAEHAIDCTLCNGSGFVDRYPLEVRGFIQNQDLEKVSLAEGLVDGNHVAITFPVGIELQYFTLIELKDFTDIYIQRVWRKAAATSLTDILSYRALRVNFLMDRTGTEYFEGTDFSLDANGDIQWSSATGARKPSDNTPYSVHYEARVQYRAVRAMHVNRFTQVRIGDRIEFMKLYEQWLCAKEFLVRRKDTFSGNDLPMGPYDAHSIVEDS